MYCVKKILQVD